MPEHICPIPPNAREDAMVVIVRNDAGLPLVWCDPCIGPLVAALNVGGIKTEWSCCGHGYRPGVIGLADGRQLIIAPDRETAKKIDTLFPLDINGKVPSDYEDGST